MAPLRPSLTALLALSGGTAAFLGLVFSTLWPLSLFAVVGYFSSSIRSSSSKSALGYGFLFGITASMGGVWWFWDTIPLTWIAVPEGLTQFLLVGIVYGLTVLSLALPFALAAPVIRKIPHAWYRPLVLAFMYITLEELRMWSFALFFLAPESALAPHFSIAGLGYILTESTLILPIAQMGHYGLNGFLALCAATILERRRAPIFIGVTSIALSLICAHALLPTTRSESMIRVGLVSSYAPAGTFIQPSLALIPLEQAARSGAEIVATPEGFGLAPFLDSEERRQLYKRLFEERNGLIISSSIIHQDNGTERAELIFETAHQGVIGSQDKIFFVPVGEYLPPLIRAAIAVAGKDALEGYEAYIKDTAVAGSSLTPATHENMRVGALLCSELLSPTLYSNLAERDTDLLFNLANNSWFHGSRLLHERLQQLAKTHALRSRQYVLVAANGSPAYAVDSRGRIVGETAWDTPDVLLIDVPLQNH